MNRFWISSSDAPFDNTDNWSETSGGSGGVTVPDSDSSVFFDGLGLGGCTLDTAVGILNLSVAGNYTGTISQNSYSVIVSKDATFAGGVFQGAGESINVYGSLHLLGGLIHTPDSSKISVYGDLVCDPNFGSWTSDNDATISMDSTRSQKIITGGILPTLVINKTSTLNQAKVFGSVDTLYINGDLIITDGTLNSNGHDIMVGNPNPPPPPQAEADFLYTYGLVVPEDWVHDMPPYAPEDTDVIFYI